PVVALNRAEIEKKGYVNVADILQDVTAAGSPSMSRASSLESGRDFGGMYVSLRNLGPERSLVLSAGRRMGVSSGGYTDLASIPTSVVERIEVLTDGASAIYGSDAIAGVVNIILKERMDGGSISVRGGTYTEGGGNSVRFSGAHGFSAFDDRFNALVNVQIESSNPIWGYQRDLTRTTNANGYTAQLPSNDFAVIDADTNRLY
ncbi:TonB-dependent receptor plug domain-containing protein, partial [Dryocola clanedunensis]